MDRRWLAVLCVALGPGMAVASGPDRPPGGRRTVLAGDTRLDRRISLREPRICLGELLERVGRETGTRLETDDRKAPISGYEVTVAVWDRPARELLESLASLYRVPPDLWFWTREGTDEKVRYVLRNTLPVDAVRLKYDAFADEFRLQEFRRNKEFYSLPPERRNELAETDPYLKIRNKPRVEGMFSFFRGLSEAEFQAIGRGFQAKEISVDRLTQGQREFIVDEFRQANLLDRPGIEQPNELRQVGISADREGTIFLEVGRTGAHGMFGGCWLKQAQRERGLREWLGEGEDTKAPDQPVPAPGEVARPEDFRIYNDTVDRLLHRLGRLGRINLLFDCPPDVKSGTFGMDFGLRGPLPEVLANLGKQMLIWKRRDAFILFRPPDYAGLHREVKIPWPILRDLRAGAERRDGYLSPAEWRSLAGLQRDQLDHLSAEFPDAGQIQRYQLFLRLIELMSPREKEAVTRPDGAGWEDWSLTTRNRLLVLFPEADARRMRMLLQWQTSEKPPAVRLYMGLEGPPLPAGTIPFRPRVVEKDPRLQPPPVAD